MIYFLKQAGNLIYGTNDIVYIVLYKEYSIVVIGKFCQVNGHCFKLLICFFRVVLRICRPVTLFVVSTGLADYVRSSEISGMGQNFFYIVDIFLTFHRIRMNQVRVCGNSYDRKIRITESITDLICFLFGDVASGKINVFKFQIQLHAAHAVLLCTLDCLCQCIWIISCKNTN